VVVVTVAGPDGCAFVHPARKAVTIRMHAQRIGNNVLFICFHRLFALSGAPEITYDDDKKPAGKQFLIPSGTQAYRCILENYTKAWEPVFSIFTPYNLLIT
jgi:hypothetical protein